ncbi:uncharacterized protein LOC131623463 [Vicia villosa]|uniref:uncharacterized protein LOC131623463 n=1 Tax=Vicia villosa TaxID=3911 RepID=UPI00273BAE67|nr:uncharacterized protein LOC131623463 [Vicia villosa]
MVDFDHLREHEFNLKSNMLIQGWEVFFDRLIGPVYPDLVKEFWIHATLTPREIIYLVLGQEVSITENLIRKLLNLEGLSGATGAVAGRTDWDAVYSEVFTTGQGSNNTKDLKAPYRIWDKILLGCIHHRKATVSPTYINQDQQYLLYCIGKGQRIDLPYLLFMYMRNHVKDSREQVKLKNQKIKRNIIPLGRLISDILTESALIDSLREAGAVQDLAATCGSTLTAHTLKKMKLITSVTSQPRVVNEIMNRRIPVDDFQMLFKEEHPKFILYYLESCLKDDTEFDPAWLHSRNLPSLDVQKAHKKRKTIGEGPSTKTKKKKKTSE